MVTLEENPLSIDRGFWNLLALFIIFDSMGAKKISTFAQDVVHSCMSLNLQALIEGDHAHNHGGRGRCIYLRENTMRTEGLESEARDPDS